MKHTKVKYLMEVEKYRDQIGDRLFCSERVEDNIQRGKELRNAI